jgi:hypothetical protein
MSDAPLFGPDDDADDIEALLRELEPTDLDATPPPADVWHGIEAAILDDQSLADPRVDTVVSITSRATRLRVVVVSVAAAVALLAVGAIVFVATGNDDAVLASAELVHESDFDPLGSEAEATALLVERESGFEIRLDDAVLPDPETNDLELWLIAARDDGSLDVQPVSLVDPDSPGTYIVPPGLDPDVYSIVDISIEPRDGNAAHSGRSILRGTLSDA